MSDEKPTAARKPKVAASGEEAALEVAGDKQIAESTVAETAPPAQQVVYVQTPAPPRKKGNRGGGAAIAIASGLIFFAGLAAFTVILGVVASGRVSFAFLGLATFYIPVLLFIISFVLLVLVANRASWWAYILGSILVGLAVYFGTIGLGLLSTGVILNTQAEASARFANQLTNPFIIFAGLFAREVALWTGAIIARRGRKQKAHNAQAHQAWQSEVSDKKAEHERTAAGAATAV